jgi:hypothetical protein
MFSISKKASEKNSTLTRYAFLFMRFLAPKKLMLIILSDIISTKNGMANLLDDKNSLKHI